MKSLKTNKDFRRVYNKGKSYASFYLVLYLLENKKNFSRNGFSISRKIGKAVVRNKLKRRMKEIIRSEEENIKIGYDLIFIARNPVNKLDFNGLKNETKKLLKKSGVMKRRK